MLKSEISEIKALFAPKLRDCRIDRLAGCYVNGEKSKVLTFKENFLSLPEEDQFKYLEIFRKTLSGTYGKNLLEMEFIDKKSTAETRREDADSKKLLRAINASALEEASTLEVLYDQIIANYNYIDNYLSLISHCSYDVPKITTDQIELEEGSDEVYNFILTAICPVKPTKPGLGYDPFSKTFKNLTQENMVELPMTGFLFPAFNERACDEDRILYYSKDTLDIRMELLEGALLCRIPMVAGNQKGTFQEIITETFGEEVSLSDVKSVHENLVRMTEEKRTESGEELLLDKDTMKELLKESGVDTERLQRFDSAFDKSFENLADAGAEQEAMAKAAVEEGKMVPTTKVKRLSQDVSPEDRVFRAGNILAGKQFEVKTPEVTVKIDSANTGLVETRVIDGKKCIVIEITEGLTVNGIPVKK